MAESDTPKPADGVRADSARGAGVLDARPTPDEDGLSATAPPEDDRADDASPVLTDWSPGQAILDDYVVERELGAGGMGKVYLLRRRSTGQPFAVKRAFLRNEDTGKELIARALHDLSPRRERTFLKLNCPASLEFSHGPPRRLRLHCHLIPGTGTL